jgi:hypothetical protein
MDLILLKTKTGNGITAIQKAHESKTSEREALLVRATMDCGSRDLSEVRQTL